MLTATRQAQTTCFRGLFPDWSGPRPLGYYMMEQLLESRRESANPTNGCGFDEDVNVYLADRLTAFLAGDHDPRIRFGSGPLIEPPLSLDSRREQAEWYRINGDHRLLMLGMFDRGDGLRRRSAIWGLDATASRTQDLNTGRVCYQMAANLLVGRPGASAGLVTVLTKLAESFDEYVRVLGELATRRFDLGARLSTIDLDRLCTGPVPASHGAGAQVEPTYRPKLEASDEMLDDLLAYRANPSTLTRNCLVRSANRLGVDPAILMQEAGPTASSENR